LLPWKGNNLIDIGIPADKGLPFQVNEPGDGRFRKSSSHRCDGGNGMDDVTKRTWFDDKNAPGLRHLR
jgi:hypothetical protein